MDKFVCTVESIVYHSPQGFTVLRVDGGKTLGTVRMVLNIPEPTIGTMLSVEGKWYTHPKHGKQFQVENYEEVLPTDELGIERYLSCGLIKGIGPATAKAMVKMFGKDVFDILDFRSTELLKVPRMTQARAEKIWYSWELQKGIREVMVFLKKYNVGTAVGVKIYNKYQNESIKQLETNPYQLIYDIDGIGFKTADDIALSMGFSPTDPLRIKSAIIYKLGNICDDKGCTYDSIKNLTWETSGLINVPSPTIQDCIFSMIEEGELFEENSNIFLPSLFHCEYNIARVLRDKVEAPPFYISEEAIDIKHVEEITGVTYEPEQIKAIKKAITSNVIVITGGPGTGKTTITRGIVTLLREFGLGILLAAPTGKAADKLSDATGMQAKTIHRLLGAKPSGEYTYNENNKLNGDVLVVDEASMINVYLMNSLFKAVPSDMRIVIIGDVDQLPCIGPGNILKDIIDSNEIPVIRLTKIYRQSDGSDIILNAHAIKNGKAPILKNKDPNSDFFFAVENDNEKIPDLIVDLVKTRLPKTYGVSPMDIQVLCPMKLNDAGTINLNNRLQEALNPVGKQLKHGDTIFRLGDKVIQCKNNYEKDVFNGDTGYIREVFEEDKTLIVNYGDKEVLYDSNSIDELMLAYALTIHKSQGSEYPFVIIPMTLSHTFMLTKKLLYTGVTRAKRMCILAGDKNAMYYAINNKNEPERDTMLKYRLWEA